MITTESAKTLSDCSLIWSRQDLKAVIEIQEATVRIHGPAACPKLGTYWDEFHAVLGEIKAREDASKPRCSCGRAAVRS